MRPSLLIESGISPCSSAAQLVMGISQSVVDGVLDSYGTYVPNGVNDNLNDIVSVADIVITFSYLYVTVYALTLAAAA